MGAGDLGGFLDVLLIGELVVVGAEYLDGADAAVEADLLQGVRVPLVVQAVTGLAGPQALLVVVVPEGTGAGQNVHRHPDPHQV